MSEHEGQFVYLFAKEKKAPPLDRALLGGKGLGLAEMTLIGLPVPSGIIITTNACKEYKREKKIPHNLRIAIEEQFKFLEESTKKKFGNPLDPLLVSVRSGARASMPGMMDTILNLGLNDETVIGFSQKTENERLAYDSYRRFIMMYGTVVCGINKKHFDQVFEVLKLQENAIQDIDISVDGLKECCILYKKIYEQETKAAFPQDPKKQLISAIGAVFNSWDSDRAKLYRQINHIPDDWGTAVIVQRMVFGNYNQHSATGVGFTRDPATGVKEFCGEFLSCAQGEDVVAGTRTPYPINHYQKETSRSKLNTLEELLPNVYKQLQEIVDCLEKHYRDMQDIEFTIENGELFMLQTRTAKRTGFAALRIAMEMLEEKIISEKEALERISPEQFGQILAQVFNEKEKKQAMNHFATKGLNAGPGAATGKAAFSSEKAVFFKKAGFSTILVRPEANPDDFAGMVAAEGILTIHGGSTSHAAVVARGMGKPCVVGCEELEFNEETKTLSKGQKILKEGDALSIDGSTGEVFFCSVPTSPSEIVQVLLKKTKDPEKSLIFQHYLKVMQLTDMYKKIHIRANADSYEDSLIAKAFGAEGIGLCRTEHMFMEVNRLTDVRKMLFSTTEDEKKKAIKALLPHQKQDFIAIFEVMHDVPVTIRLLDPPLHEFMPHNDEELTTLAILMHVPKETLFSIRASIQEQNPMLGLRGCRLGILYPELTKMQVRAIIEAALEVTSRGKNIHVEIMIPLISLQSEFEHQKSLVDQTAEEVFKEKGQKITYKIGTMIELPRAALIAQELAENATFFSFGTNDLTQTTFGISRDDSSKFVPLYMNGVPHPNSSSNLWHILKENPFHTIDETGVGRLMKIAVTEGRRSRPELECGICGEHGGEAKSIAFCYTIGLNYVSCSPFRVPVARLAAALAAIRENN